MRREIVETPVLQRTSQTLISNAQSLTVGEACQILTNALARGHHTHVVHIATYTAALFLTAMAAVAHAQIRCDEFEIVATRDGSDLTFHLETDLPNDTSVWLSVSRSYWERGGGGSEYSIDYVSESSSVGALRTTRTVSIAHSVWQRKLRSKQNEMSRIGLGFEVGKTRDDVKISMVVTTKQTNPAFGDWNANLTGRAVERKGVSRVRVERSFAYPLDQADTNRKSAPSLDPLNLGIGVTYRLSKQTPLMPAVNPRNPIDALKRAKNMPPGTTIKILEKTKVRATPWYRVVIVDIVGAVRDKGWVNSTALLGQKLDAVRDH